MAGNIPRALLVIAAAAFLVRLAIAGGILLNFGEDGFSLGDSGGFYQTAQNLLEGRGFTRDPAEPFRPSAFFPPLYPLLIAGSLAVSGSVIPLILLQILLSSLLPILMWKIARELSDRKLVWYGAATLTAFEPLGMLWGSVIITDTTAVFSLTLALLFFIRLLLKNHSSKEALYAGMALGISSLIRPEPYYLFFVSVLALAGAAALKKFPRKPVFIFAAVFLAVISPWILRNYVQFGSPFGSATGARNIYTDLAVSVETYRTGKPYDEVENELELSFAERYGINPKDISENPALGPLLAEEGLKIIFQNPKATAVTLVITANSFFTQDLYATYLRRFEVIPRFRMDFSPSVVLLKEGPLELWRRVWGMLGALVAIPLAGRLFWIALNILWVAGAFFAIKKGGRERLVGAILGALILIYAGGSLAAGFSDHGRHRYPVNGPLFVLAAFGAYQILQRFRRGALR